ncbi:MAG: vWA domain-containing protein [Planctomycetota bacterium]|jgi:hypothetical protein
MKRSLAIVLAATLSGVVSARPPARPPEPDGGAVRRVDWSAVPAPERQLLAGLQTSPHWPDRVFALLRLERYAGTPVDEMLRAALADEAWQVRCFAVHQAMRLELVRPEDLAVEEHGAVVREALRCGVALDPARVEEGARRLMQREDLDELMLGLEIAALSGQAALRDEASRRTVRLLGRMDEATLIRISRRLARLLDLDEEPPDVAAWAAWWDGQGSTLELPEPAPPTLPSRSLVSTLELEELARLMDYLDGLRHRDLDLVITMDATASMLPMINEARAGIDSLIVFLDDLARVARVAFVAYRDHDNAPVWEGHPFSTDAASVRRFLYGVRITGGADLPEAVLEGLAASTRLDWNGRATRQVVLVGDAEPHAADAQRLTALLGAFAEEGITVNAVHVPMRPDEAFLRRMPPPRVAAYRRQIDQHNQRTETAFAEIARLGGGRMVTVTRASELVPAIMHLTIEPAWWPAFDEFYSLYLGRCR